MIWKKETIIIRYLAHELLEFYLLKKTMKKSLTARHVSLWDMGAERINYSATEEGKLSNKTNYHK